MSTLYDRMVQCIEEFENDKYLICGDFNLVKYYIIYII